MVCKENVLEEQCKNHAMQIFLLLSTKTVKVKARKLQNLELEIVLIFGSSWINLNLKHKSIILILKLTLALSNDYKNDRDSKLIYQIKLNQSTNLLNQKKVKMSHYTLLIYIAHDLQHTTPGQVPYGLDV